MDLGAVSTQCSALDAYAGPCRVDAEDGSRCNTWVIDGRRGADSACFTPLPMDLVLQQQNVRSRRAEDEAAKSQTQLAMPLANTCRTRDCEANAQQTQPHLQITRTPSQLQSAAITAYGPGAPLTPGNLIDLVV